MLLGTDELTILRGSKFYGTWQWINSVTGDPEDFEGLTATIKIKNINEEFADIKNTFEVGIATVEPEDIDGNATKGRIEISLSKEDTLNFAIPEFEDDRYGESDFYGVLSITLSTGEVILQAKTRIVDSLESETLNFLIDERGEAIIINGKLDNILARNNEYISARDNLIDVVIPTAIDTYNEKLDLYNQNYIEKLDTYNLNHSDKLQILEDIATIVSEDKNIVEQDKIDIEAIKQNVQENKDSVTSMKDEIITLSEQIDQDANDALASKNASKQSEDNAKQSEEVAIAKANKILNLSVETETLAPNEEATSSYNPTTGILNIGVPKGDKGNPFVYSDFTPEQLSLLKGVDGIDGLSAYEVAVNNGFVGTELQWIDSLSANVSESSIPNLPISKITNLESSLNDKLNISDIVDSLASVDINKPLSAKQGKVLKELIDNINTILMSDDTTLDQMQEVVNFIKQNKTDLQNLDLSNIAETTTLKHFTATLLAKLNGIEDNANNYTHPANHSPSIIAQDSNNRFVSDTEKASWNQKQEPLTLKTINNNSIVGSGDLTIGGIPTGTIIEFSASTAPTGYLKCNGALLSRTTYAALFAVIGTTFGVGDGSTTFALPDMRGYFPRGFDDGRGIDTGRTFGSIQADDFKSHIHANGAYNTGYMANSGSSLGGYTVTTNTSATGGTETRPKNIALLYCIKY